MRNATLICDMQFGSTGKGLIAGYLAERDAPDVVMTAWSANAGHTYISSNGTKYVHTMIANGCVSPKLTHILIGPGSCLNLNALFKEARHIKWPDSFRGIFIHPNAMVIQDQHHKAEQGPMLAIGSTRKGVGECMIQKIRRDPKANSTVYDYQENIAFRSDGSGVPVTVVTQSQYHHTWENARRILIEGAQGFSLGINSGMYPYVTSRECTPAQILSDLCLPMGIVEKVIGTMRTYPIRVANRYNDVGHMVGTSGPGYHDQREMEWKEIGIEPEQTTVTKLPRRIFTFSRAQTVAAMRQCTPDEIFLNFVNYLGNTEQMLDMSKQINTIASNNGSGGIRYLGFGPSYDDVGDLQTGYDDLVKEKEQFNVGK